MNIAFLPEDRRMFKGHKINQNLDNLNEDSFWMASIINDVPPDGGTYLYMLNPKTDYSIIYPLKGKWRNNIKEHIEKAFLVEFENLETKGSPVDGYVEYLNKINLTTIPKHHFDQIELIRERTEDFYDLYFDNYVPEGYFVADLELDDYKEALNEDYDGHKNPKEKITKLLKKYEELEPLREFDFEVNKKALELPKKSNTVYKIDDNGFHDTARIFEGALLIKEPTETNYLKLKKISEEVTDLIEESESNPELNQKKIERLLKQANKYITYEPSPFFGEYDYVDFPEVLPEKPVFIFNIILGTGVYLASRRIAVPADMMFTDFDKLLLHLFRWTGLPHHMSEFLFPLKNKPEGKEVSEILVWQEEDLPEEIELQPVDFEGLKINNPFDGIPTKDIKGKKLIDYFPEFKTAQYRYDFGDNWFHSIELAGIEDQNDFDKPLPYLLESSGVAPIEDSGGSEAFGSLIYRDFDFFEEDDFVKRANDWFKEREMILRAPCSLAPLFETEE